MKNVTFRAAQVVAVGAAAISISCLFVPYAYPLPSIAWAMLACAAGVWVAKYSRPEGPSVNDVIRGVEAESALARAVPVRVTARPGKSGDGMEN